MVADPGSQARVLYQHSRVYVSETSKSPNRTEPIDKLDQHFLTEEFKNVSFWLASRYLYGIEILKEDHPRINPKKLVKFFLLV